MALPLSPDAFPYSSEDGTPMNATSMDSSPVSMALALPPWLLKMTGFSISPLESLVPVHLEATGGDACDHAILDMLDQRTMNSCQ